MADELIYDVFSKDVQHDKEGWKLVGKTSIALLAEKMAWFLQFRYQLHCEVRSTFYHPDSMGAKEIEDINARLVKSR